MSESKFRANWTWVWRWVAAIGWLIPGQLDELASEFALQPKVLNEIVAMGKRFGFVKPDDQPPPAIEMPSKPTFPTWPNAV
jgi:hypothetical protein